MREIFNPLDLRFHDLLAILGLFAWPRKFLTNKGEGVIDNLDQQPLLLWCLHQGVSNIVPSGTFELRIDCQLPSVCQLRRLGYALLDPDSLDGKIAIHDMIHIVCPARDNIRQATESCLPRQGWNS